MNDEQARRIADWALGRTTRHGQPLRMGLDKADKLKQTIAMLEDLLGIELPADTTAENLMDYLHAAALTSAAHKGLDALGSDSQAKVVEDEGGIAAVALACRLPTLPMTSVSCLPPRR